MGPTMSENGTMIAKKRMKEVLVFMEVQHDW
jgi:hypothetical protein